MNNVLYADFSKNKMPSVIQHNKDNVVKVDFKNQVPDSVEAVKRLLKEQGMFLREEGMTNGEVYAHFKSLLEHGIVQVALDPKTPGVVVPPMYLHDDSLTLNFSNGFRIEDFIHSNYGVQASLTFKGNSFFCVVPWAAVGMLKLLKKESKV